MRVGIGGDHGGFLLKAYLSEQIVRSGHELIDFGAATLDPDDDYPDYVIPLARAVAGGEVTRGIAVCGSGVGVCVAANKIVNARAALVHDTFSAHQGVEDDNLNMLCLGARVVGFMLAGEIVERYLAATFSGAPRHMRRIAKVRALEAAG